MKPRMKRNRAGCWRCQSDTAHAVADTPLRAYQLWKREDFNIRLYGKRGWQHEQRQHRIAELMDLGASRAEAECDTGVFL